MNLKERINLCEDTIKCPFELYEISYKLKEISNEKYHLQILHVSPVALLIRQRLKAKSDIFYFSHSFATVCQNRLKIIFSVHPDAKPQFNSKIVNLHFLTWGTEPFH
jgi:hypothetical protein